MRGDLRKIETSRVYFVFRPIRLCGNNQILATAVIINFFHGIRIGRDTLAIVGLGVGSQLEAFARIRISSAAMPFLFFDVRQPAGGWRRGGGGWFNTSPMF